MPEPLTIEQAHDVPEVTEDQAATAEAEATRLAAEAGRLHASALASGKDAPTGAEIADARAMADLAAEIAVIRRAEAGRHAEAERLRAIEALGTDVEKFAARAASDDGIAAAVRKVTAARDEFLARVAAHNDELAGLRARGTALGIEKLPMNGVLSPASAYVHDAIGGLRTKAVHVHPVGPREAAYALQQAADGHPEKGITAIPVAEIYQPKEGQ